MPLDDALVGDDSPFPAFLRLSPKAIAYFLVVALATLAVCVPCVPRIDGDTGHWITFALLAIAVSLAQFYVVRTPGNPGRTTRRASS